MNKSRTGIDGMSFTKAWPTGTAGDGYVRPNNARPGKWQPNARPSRRRKVACKQCGFRGADLTRAASDGGDLNGDGGGGTITITSGAGDQAYKGGRGCPLCFSPNYANSSTKRL